MEKITFIPDTQEEPVEFYVLEQTRLGGFNYILVSDVEEGDGEDFRTDLHNRFNTKGDKISFDTIHNGKREIAELDYSNL